MFPAEHHIESLHRDSLEYARDFRILKGIDFCSNDYLSLKAHPTIKQQLADYFAHEHAWCSTGSRLVSGTNAAILKLESEFAEFVNRPQALFFANGYQANISVISSVLADCKIFSDALNHASIIDGMKLSASEKFIYRHNDLDHLETALKRPAKRVKAIITESVFSTSGAFADLASLIFLADKYHAFLVVDEAHATGIFGEKGAGLLSDYALASDHIISTHSCGKALGSFGAFVACSDKIAAIIRNMSRSFICTTAPPPYVIAHVQAALRLINNNSALRTQLHVNIAYSQGVLKSNSPIIAIVVHDDDRALAIRDDLARNNFDVAAFRYPSVRPGHAQLRISLHAGNTFSQIDDLQNELARLL